MDFAERIILTALIHFGNIAGGSANPDDWQVDILQHYNYLVSKGGVVTWTICKAPGKIFPLAYKEFLKCKFQGVNMPTINKLDMFYDRYIKSYNEIYKREMDKYNQQVECA